MESVGNVNHAVSIVRYWISDPNYKHALLLKIDSLNLIYSPTEGEGTFSVFETVFHTVIYTSKKGKLKITE